MHDAQDHSGSHRRRSRVLLLIGALKLFKAALLVLAGIGAHKLLHRDVAEQLTIWVSDLRLDPGSRYLYAAIQKLGLLDDHHLRQLSFGAFFYASLLTLEGVGLCLSKRWAEYFTAIMTASLLPLEVLEIAHRVTVLRVLLLLVNLAIVVYLIRRLIRERRAEVETAPGPG
jgi:uncharacterized membrane protein (DUF2068 family)